MRQQRIAAARSNIAQRPYRAKSKASPSQTRCIVYKPSTWHGAAAQYLAIAYGSVKKRRNIAKRHLSAHPQS